MTTIYVTHDQVEAMTMGDRVAVMRKGELQQVADPQTLYDRPVNLFVAGFIGSPAMNMLEATVERANGSLALALGDQRLLLDAEAVAQRPALADHVGAPVILGIRPEDLEDAALVPDTPADRRLRGTVELREALGSELHVHFSVPGVSAAVTEEVQELAEDTGDERTQETGAAGALLVGRFNARADVREGRAGRGGGRHARAPFLRARHRTRDLRPHGKRRHDVRNRWTRPAAAVAVAALAVLVAAVGASATKTAAPASPAAVSGSISFDGVWTGAEAASFQAVINGFKKLYPKVKVNYKPVGDNLPTVLSTAVAGGNPPDMADIAQPGLVQQFVAKKALKPITYAAPVVKANFAPVWLKLGTYNGKLYGIVFKAANKSTVWYNAHSFSAAGVKAPATWTQFLDNAKTIHASGTPAYSIGGADGWTLTDLFENIYLRQAGQAKYLLLTAHKIPWTDASVKLALTTMAQGAR